MRHRSFSFAAVTMVLVACSSGEFRSDSEPVRGEPDAGPAASDVGGDSTNEGPKGQPTVCSDECPVELERDCDPAAPGSFRSCLRGANGCLGWTSATCQNGAPTCTDAKGGCIGTCPPAGKEACTQEGATRCQGDKVDTCTIEGGCLVWSGAKDCATAGHKCIGEKCQSTCTSNCATAGAVRCLTGTNLQETCNEVQPGCLQWGSQKNCGSGFSCILATGQCVACNDSGCSAANVGTKRCSGDVQTCQLAYGACYKWAVTTACGTSCCNATTKTCANSTSACGRTCTNCNILCAQGGQSAYACPASGNCDCRD